MCAFNTTRIINRYHPKYWVIENPQGSQIWKYLEYYHNFTGYRNIAHYAKYNEAFPKKPTCFLSNIKLDLKTMGKDEKATVTINPKAAKRYGTKYYGRDYNVRSDIPNELIVDILEQINAYE